MSAELEQLQRWMQDSLMFPGLVEPHKVSQLIKSGAHISSLDGLGIYQRSYYARLLACMREQFPATCYCLGETVFNQFVIEYLRHNPSDSYTLYQLGRRFIDYLQQTRPDKGGQKELWIEFMVELAEFERLAFNLFDAPGSEGYLLEQLLDDQQLNLQQGICLHQSQFPVARYYCLVRDEQQPKLPPLQASFVALVRVDYTTRLELLNRWQYQFLYLWQQGNSITQALEIVSQNTQQDIATHWPVWRKHWLKRGFFVRAELSPKTRV